MKRVQTYAQKTFLAMDNRYKSVKRVFPNSIESISETTGFYVGTKEVPLISTSFIHSLKEKGYHHHTIDKASHSGRAIDLDLINPLTGKYMTGSSSGTALNVFLGINDLGIGTDGGGSVLAPAMSLNLYSLIHPELGQRDNQTKEVKKSTDGIAFSPSIGLISKQLNHIEKIISEEFDLEATTNSSELKIGVDSVALDRFDGSEYLVKPIEMTGKYTKTRKKLIDELNNYLTDFDVIISKEGPIDLNGFGDTVFGHFSKETTTMQEAANKGFIKVVNMIQAVGITVPTTGLGEGYLLITKAENHKIAFLLELANYLSSDSDELIERYFGDLSKYFEHGI